MRKVVFAMRLWVRCYWGGQCLCFQTFDTNVGRTKFTTLTINHIALIDIFLFGWTWEISRKKSRAWPGKRRETFPFFWSIFQWTYPFTDGRIVAVPLWYPLHHWHHGLQVPSAPRWCHLHCTCLRPWRNGDGNNGNCFFSTLGMKRIRKITIVLENLLMRWLFVYMKIYEEEFFEKAYLVCGDFFVNTSQQLLKWLLSSHVVPSLHLRPGNQSRHREQW